MTITILLIFALVCFVLAALELSPPYWNKLMAAGLAFLTASFLVR